MFLHVILVCIIVPWKYLAKLTGTQIPWSPIFNKIEIKSIALAVLSGNHHF